LIPEEIDRRPKTGFGVPLDAWFRGELREMAGDLLLAPNARYRDYIAAASFTGPSSATRTAQRMRVRGCGHY
jgi:hypothetical protein